MAEIVVIPRLTHFCDSQVHVLLDSCTSYCWITDVLSMLVKPHQRATSTSASQGLTDWHRDSPRCQPWWRRAPSKSIPTPVAPYQQQPRQ